MANQEVKLIITSDASGAISGIKQVGAATKKLETDTGGLIGNIKSHWLGFTAAVVGAAATARQAWDLAKMAADFNEQMSLLNGLAGQYNTTAGTIVDKVKEVSDGMISMSAAAEVASAGLAKGLTPEMVEGIAKASATLSDFMGMNAENAFKKLAEGLELGREKTIKFATGAFDLKERFGEAVDKMTEGEKQMALYAMVTEKAADIQKRVGDQAKSTADKMDTLVATLKDLQLYLGQGILRAAAATIGAFQGAAGAALWLSGGIFGIIKAITSLTDYVHLTTNASQEWKIAQEAANNAAAELWGKAKDNFSAAIAPAEQFQKAMGGAAKEAPKNQAALDKMASAMEKWKEKIDRLNPSLDATSKEMANLVYEADKLRKEFGDQKWISEGMDQGLGFLLTKQNLEGAVKAFESVKDAAISVMEVEKKANEERIEDLKTYRTYLKETYDYALGRAKAYYAESAKINDLLTHGKAFLAAQGPQLSASDQMRREKTAAQDLISSAWLSSDSADVGKAMSAVESFMDKYKNSKSVLGFSEDFSSLTEEYKGLVQKLEYMKTASDDAGAAWEAAAARQVAAIQNVDEWMVYLQNEVRNLDGLIAQTREIKIDTSMAENKIVNLTNQVRGLMALVAGAANAGQISADAQYQLEQNIYDNMANGRSPLNNASLTGVE